MMNKIALVGNFPPRKCGIATFTNDLNDGISINGIATSVIAMNDGVRKYDYPAPVAFEIDQNEITGYMDAAEYINTHNFDAVVLQHEFGIFGGPDGKHILQLLKRVAIPVITTFHTILDNPSEGQRSVVNEIACLSKKIISISKKGIEILKETYGIPPSKCKHIHHGVHPTQPVDTESFKQKLGVRNKKILLTFGLLSRNKSIEVVINALPDVVRKHPDVVYIILGATHPHVVRHEGEEYRDYLVRLATELGLENHVMFIDRFVSNEELFEFLRVCDIYVIPYLGQKQISSGTLIYAMGAGKPVISTPFWYAEEMLAEERGMLFDFNDSRQLVQRIVLLLDDKDQREAIARNAFALAEECYWHQIGRQYIELLERLAAEYQPHTLHEQPPTATETTLPAINLNHLRTMTDDTGLLQHARYTIPDRSHGYCTDDNARALILCVMLQDHYPKMDELNRLTGIYLSFLDYAWNPGNKRFRNFMSYDRRWLEEEGSQDCAGRALWALGYTAAYTHVEPFFHHSNSLFRKGLEEFDYITHPRALAYLNLGLVHYTHMHNDAAVNSLLKKKSRQLSSLFDSCIGCAEWPWFDQIVTYGNNRIPQALIAAGIQLNDPSLAERGIQLLDWLIDKQFISGLGLFSCIGNYGWMTPEKKAAFDQQPLEANGMIDSCLMAQKYTANKKYMDYALKTYEWFTGNNACSCTLYDAATGGCRDGLHSNGVNLNQGAESTLSWLLSLVRITSLMQNKENKPLYDCCK